MITVLGWVLSLVGVYRIVAPQFVNFVGTAILAHDNFFTGAGIVLLGLSDFLTLLRGVSRWNSMEKRP